MRIMLGKGVMINGSNRGSGWRVGGGGEWEDREEGKEWG